VFEPEQQKHTRMGTPAKIIAISAAGFLLSLGLCGVGGALSSHNISGFLFVAGLAVLFASILGVLVGICWLIIAANSNAGHK
jgi:hypothetical protein